ncbi:HAD-IA family hydrolase [Roseomonas terrae]|jgi:phosphoglycolate phosphatase|uniref:phosphoglycolate phosphatase n=1 Tax=Neoroseomonas terrae TaxID=424799 RepID=A0ABS5EIV5_9PROT|nr:HAD-IA family hydrolase [Neoroseomonas terrae]MBR0650955.1 HAD-IA family hydrolase [Neoroseomonas terrae]
MDRIAVFDLDGTLVDSAADIHVSLDRAMAGLGLPGFSRAEVVAMIGDGVRALMTKALAARGRPLDEAVLARFVDDYTAQATVLTRPFEGIPEVLDALAAQGWRLAVCTNKPAEATRVLLNELGLTDRFVTLGCGDSFPVRKPDPQHLLATLAAAASSAAGAVMIGDHRNDVQAASGAGVPCIFAGWGYGPVAMADGAPVATAPGELPRMIAGLFA